MREMLTMEETLRKCSFQLPVGPGCFQKPEDCKDSEECGVLTPVKETIEPSNKVVLGEELECTPFHKTVTGTKKFLSFSSFIGHDNSSQKCSANSVLKIPSEKEHSDVELKCYNYKSDFRPTCYHDANLCASKLIDSEKDNLHDLEIVKHENINGNSVDCLSFENNNDSCKYVNTEVSKRWSLATVKEPEHTNEKKREDLNQCCKECEGNPTLDETRSMREKQNEDDNKFCEGYEFNPIIKETVSTNGENIEDENELHFSCNIRETQHITEDQDLRNKLHEVNELNPNCENKLEGVDNSSGYLSQFVPNSVTEGAADQCPGINENCVKSRTEPLPSSAEDKNEKSLTRSNSSKLQETEGTKNHINYLLRRLPKLGKYFDLHKKIGVGTFSSVFLASIKEDVADRFPKLKGRKFAIKHLVPTLLPRHITRELKYLNQIGGKDNVVGVDLAVRNGDCVIFIMPYLAHKRFSEYVLEMDVEEARDYMLNLMIALKRVHSFNVIHRDVKPSNFLYNRQSKRYLLVDFGLSQTVHPRAKRTVEERVKKRKRQEENYSENIRKATQKSYRTSVTDLRSKKIVPHFREKEENVMQVENGISQPLKRLKLSDPYARGQRMIDHLNQQKSTSESKRAPLTLRMANQNASVPESIKSFNSSAKVVEKDSSIKKNLFPSNDENEKPKTQGANIKVESPVYSNISSPFGLRKPTHQNIVGHKSSPFALSSKTELVARPLVSNLESESSKQKFQTLFPKPSKDGNNCGSTVVRVQNSQVKSQMLKPLSPLESEQQRKLLINKQRNKNVSQTFKNTKCSCKDSPQNCSTCMKKQNIRAPRAGTPGFRPPEVLLKYPMQTTAVDMWAAGVIMLCVLSGCYPFFRSPDDITGLAEMMTVFGTDRIKEVAKTLGRTVQCSNHKPPLDLRKLCERLRRRRKERVSGVPDTTNTLPICPLCDNSIDIEQDGCLCLGSEKSGSSCGEFPPSAYDLLQKLLDLNPLTRISAEEALQHPFLRGE